MRRAPILALLGLLLAVALPVGAQDAYQAPAGGAADESAQPAEQAPPAVRKVHPISKRVSRYLDKVLEFMQTNKFAEAEELLARVSRNSRLNPSERAKIQQFRGNVSVYKNDAPTAVKHLSEALSMEGLDLASEQQVTFQLASLHAQQQDFPKAMEILDRWFLAATEPMPEAYYLKAVIMIQMLRPADAIVAAEQAVALSPNPREGWLSLLAHSYFLVKDFGKMATTLETLIARVPTKKSYWMLLSAAYYELDRDEEARSVVQLANRQGLLDQDREVRALARLLLASGIPFEGAAVLEKGIADGLVPSQEDTYELLANCLLQAREGDQALVPLAKGADLSEDAQLSMVLGKVHLQRRRFEEALAALTIGLPKANAEQRGRVYLLIGVAQLGANRLDEAERAFRSASDDERARTDAESYLKFVTQERERLRALGA